MQFRETLANLVTDRALIKSNQKGGLFCLAAGMLDCTGATTISIMSVHLCKFALSCKHAKNKYI